LQDISCDKQIGRSGQTVTTAAQFVKRKPVRLKCMDGMPHRRPCQAECGAKLLAGVKPAVGQKTQ
jgi:hypothetical protein